MKFILFLLSMNLFAGTPEEEGLKLAQKMEKASKGFLSEHSSMQMVLIDSYGTKISRTLESKTIESSDDINKSILTFISPKDVKGTKLLTVSKKKAMISSGYFFQALKEKKRISGRAKTGSFLGSEFTYEDLTFGDIDKFSYKVISEGKEGTLLERKRKGKSAYSKQVLLVSLEYLAPVKIEYFNKRGEISKIATFTDWKRSESNKKFFWKSNHIHMKNLLTKKESIFKWVKRSFGEKINPTIFRPGSLK